MKYIHMKDVKNFKADMKTGETPIQAFSAGAGFVLSIFLISVLFTIVSHW